MDAFFQDGLPGRITADDFKRKYLTHFPDFADGHDDILEDAIDTVYVQFHGVQTLWDLHGTHDDARGRQVWFDKTRLCFLHLTAWFIADVCPEFVSGVPVVGGVPVKRKKIGGTDITFQDTSTAVASDLLAGLLSNPFGKQAYMMIKTSAKRAALR